jgi:hypothetical protein
MTIRRCPGPFQAPDSALRLEDAEKPAEQQSENRSIHAVGAS